MSFQTPITIPTGHFHCIALGTLTLLVANQDEEWLYTSWNADTAPALPETGKNESLPSEIDWIRWDHAENDCTIKLLPAFPELPLIARPQGTINIPSGGSALFHIGIPASIEIHATSEGSFTKIASIPTQTLSKTWHGNQHKGEACYALTTHARRNIENLATYAHDIICQVEVQNTSESVATFERLYLETGHLGIFQKGDQLWSNASRIKIKEEGETFTRIVFSDKPLSPAADASSLAEPSLGKTRKSALHNTFSSFLDVLS